MKEKMIEHVIIGSTVAIIGLVVIIGGAVAFLLMLRKEPPKEYSYTRILCREHEEHSYCVDVFVSCVDGSVKSVKIITEPVLMDAVESPLGWCRK